MAMEKEPYRPGLGNDHTLVAQLKEFENNPKSLVFAALSECYRAKGLVRQALEICEEGLEENPGFSAGLIVKARCFFDLKRYADSLKIVSRLLKENSENIRAEKLRGDIFLHLGQERQAITSLKRVLELFPGDRETARKLSAIRKPMEQVVEEAPLWNISSNDAPPGDVQDFQVKSLGTEWDEFDARSEQEPIDITEEKQEDFNDEPVFATKTVAELYLRQGLKKKAEAVLRAMLQKKPGDDWAERTLAQMLNTNGITVKNDLGLRTKLMLKAQFFRESFE